MKYHSLSFFLVFVFTVGFYSNETHSQVKDNGYSQLVVLFGEWRNFEKPPLRKGAPDYTKETFDNRQSNFKSLQDKLMAIDTTNWPIPHQVDWHIVRAEMNGYDFNYRVLKPWERDPAYYKSLWEDRSDVPAHEGPTHHMTTELWTYAFPLSKDDRQRLLSDLKVISPLNEQAKINLTGNAKDLWIAGIRDIERQSIDLKKILSFEGIAKDKEIQIVLQNAIASTDNLVSWLKEMS
ncbi:MAG: hypothetical protein NWP87_07030, partial [Winogradskyella sp.]|nr:hypothetical protein [Winogradskyella sp.]